MAKALMGYLPNDLRSTQHLATDNAKLRARIAELNDLVDSLKTENDLLVARMADLVESSLSEMQPA
jgi:cell division protein FtsB